MPSISFRLPSFIWKRFFFFFFNGFFEEFDNLSLKMQAQVGKVAFISFVPTPLQEIVCL